MFIARKKDGLVFQETNQEVLVYDLLTNRAMCLNQTAAVVWNNCAGRTTVSEIAKRVEKILGKPVTDEVAWLAIDQLKKADLIQVSGSYSNAFEALTRREIIKKIGFTSAIALPIVSILTAPVAAQISSCPPSGTGMADIPVGSGCPCVQPQDCSGGSCIGLTMTC